MGIGTYNWPDGTRYEGQWSNNTFDGYGIYYFSNDRAYFGEWKNKKKMDLENLFGLIENILDFILMIKKMDLAFQFGKMDIKQLLDFGKKENNLVLENL